MTVAAVSRRRWRPQFSLRSLLLAVTALCLVIPGGVGWWRWPFEVEESTSSSEWKHEELLEWEGVPEHQRKARANKVVLPTQPYKQVAQVYREVTGALVRHGAVATYDYKGRKLRDERWHHGKLHGRWTDWDLDGDVIAYGQYEHGVKHGGWFDRRPQAPGWATMHTRTAMYRNGATCFEAHRVEDPRRPMFNELSVTSYPVNATGPPTRRQVWDANSMVLIEDVPYSFVEIVGVQEHVGQPVEHGLVKSWHRSGQPQEEVAYENGRRLGAARGWHASGSKWYEGAFDAGLEHGRWTWWNADGTVFRTAEFDHGRLLQREGPPLPRLPLPEIGWGEPRCVCELDRPTYSTFSQIALKDVVNYLSEFHGTLILIDVPGLQAAQIPSDTPITYTFPMPPMPRLGGRVRGVTLRSQLQLLLEALGLVPVIRHEGVVITTPDAARKWRDTAGIEAIAAKSNSPFAAALRKTMQLPILGVPLHVALRDLSKQHGIAIRLAPDAPPELANRQIIAHDRSVSLAAALGRLFEEHGLCCEEQGDELLVRPVKREENSESP